MNIQVNDNVGKNIDLNLFNDLNTTMLINENFEGKNENDIDKLISMGFEQKMVKKVYVLLKPRNEEEAIYLLTQDKGKYHHFFIERHGRENECFICGSNLESHINFIPNGKPRKKSILNKIKDKFTNDNFNKELSEIKDPLIASEEETSESNSNTNLICDVCGDDISSKDKRENELPCKHIFCSDCYINYFKRKIEENDVSKMSCMQHGCPQELDDKFIEMHLKEDKELFEKYLKFKKRNEIYKNPNLVACPIPNCESYAKKNEENKFVICQNGHKFCSECKGKWHKGKDCDTEALGDYIKEFHLKSCPRCGAKTEKNLGCNHMQCNCGCHWCWFCKNEFQSENEHYGVYGHCPNLHFTTKEMYNNCCILCIHNTWMKIMHEFILLFIITSLSPSYFLRKYRRTFNDDTFKRIVKFMYYFGAIYSIAYLGLFLPIGILAFLICNIVRKLKRKAIIYVLDLDDNEEE